MLEPAIRALRPWLPVLAVPVFLVLMYGSATVSPASSDSEVIIACDGSTGIEARECQPWGDAILAKGPPAPNVVMTELTGLDIHRALWGYIDHCTVKYLVFDSVIHEREITCR